jgi:protein TonB
MAHASLYAAYLALRPQQPLGAEDSPAVIIDLSPMTVAPVAQSQESTPAPELPPPPEFVEPPETKVDQPKLDMHAEAKIEPTPSPNPEVVLPQPVPDSRPPDKPRPVDKPDEAKPMPPPRPQAAPPAAARVAPVAATARPGIREGKALPPSWVQRLLAHLNHYKQYPGTARLKHEQGVVTLTFTMDRNGHVLARHVARSSGSAELDREVLEMLRRAEPLPRLPPNVAGSTRSFNVPIRFSLR